MSAHLPSIDSMPAGQPKGYIVTKRGREVIRAVFRSAEEYARRETGDLAYFEARLALIHAGHVRLFVRDDPSRWDLVHVLAEDRTRGKDDELYVGQWPVNVTHRHDRHALRWQAAELARTMDPDALAPSGAASYVATGGLVAAEAWRP